MDQMTSSQYYDKKRWIPERGFIVNLRYLIQKMETHPYFDSVREWVVPRQILVNLCEADDDEYFMEDFIHDLEIDLGFHLFGNDRDQLQRFLSNIREELFAQIESVYGKTDNLPVFERWLNGYDAIFVSRQGHFEEITDKDKGSNPFERIVGRYRRLVSLLKRSSRSR